MMDLMKYSVIVVLMGFPEEHCRTVMELVKETLDMVGPIKAEEVGTICVPDGNEEQYVLLYVKEYVFDAVKLPLGKALGVYLEGRQWYTSLHVKRLENLEYQVA
jgi:hypothetical protein